MRWWSRPAARHRAPRGRLAARPDDGRRRAALATVAVAGPRPAAPAVPAGALRPVPRVDLGFRDGTIVELPAESGAARALQRLAGALLTGR